MNDSNQKRMIADTGYEVKHAVQMGDREILLAENLNDPEGQFYLKAEYSDCGFLGQYDRLIYCSGYLAAMEEFIGSIDSQVVAVRAEIDKTDYQAKLFAADQCYPNDYGQSINEKVAVIKVEVLRPDIGRYFSSREKALTNLHTRADKERGNILPDRARKGISRDDAR